LTTPVPKVDHGQSFSVMHMIFTKFDLASYDGTEKQRHD